MRFLGRGDKRQSDLNTMLRGLLLGTGLLLAFAAGFLIRGDLADALTNQEETYSLLSEVRQLISEHYLRPLPGDTELEYAAIRGMMAVLDDPYTFFNPPPVTRSEADALAGQYGGIGVDVQYAADGRFVLYPYPDSPAALAGVQAGDVLLAVDDRTLATGTSLDEVRQLLRGEVRNGNGVRLQLQKQATGIIEDYNVPFALITVPSVMWRVLLEEPRFGYIQVSLFTSRTPDEVQTALTDLVDHSVEAIIFDLRNNPGGLLQESIEVADMFLAKGIIYYEQTKDAERSRSAQDDGDEPTVPVLVIVNQRTASAAELVAGALHDSGQAQILGQTTNGKGSVQLIFPLLDGSSVHITAAEWYTPNRLPLSGTGLVPDIPMIPAQDGRDVELDEAVRRLREIVANTGSN